MDILEERMYTRREAWRIHWPIKVGAELQAMGIDTVEAEEMYSAPYPRTVRGPGLDGTIDVVGETSSGRFLWLVIEPRSDDLMLVVKELLELTQNEVEDTRRRAHA
jgi:hypothetical protein